MHINIKQHFKPFFTTFGSECLLPGTTLSFQIYPTKIIVKDQQTQTPKLLLTLYNTLNGPITNFLITCDLDKKQIVMDGYSKDGFFRFVIYANDQGFKIDQLKFPENLKWSSEGMTSFELQDHSLICNIPHLVLEKRDSLETLHLGIFKKQDWDLVTRRLLMEEILPFWFILGQVTPHFALNKDETLFNHCLTSIQNREKTEIVDHLKNLFLAGFSELLIPRLIDESYQGFSVPPICSISPLALLTNGYLAIRRMFFQEEENFLTILGSLPPEFHCGRLINLHTSHGIFDLEWSKKRIRRMVFKCTKKTSLRLLFQKRILSYRLTIHKDETLRISNDGIPLDFEKDKIYYFDNFKS